MPDWRPVSGVDWREEASRKLADSKLSASEREEISRELAGYLEDLCSDAPARGLDDSAATQSAAAELYEDKHLGAHLFRARKEGNMMNDRTKRLWLPGITVLLGALLYLRQLENLELHTLWLSRRWFLTFDVPWLCGLSLLGAAAAYWSRRQGGSRVTQAIAGLFPALLFIAEFVAARQNLPWFKSHATSFFHGLAYYALQFVVIPSAALLLGILPFLRGSSVARRTA